MNDIHLESGWKTALTAHLCSPSFTTLRSFVHEAYSSSVCYPPPKYIFRAFELTPFDQVRVVILGQDPYHTPGAAMGLSFSVPSRSRPQPSLRNIFKELYSDFSILRDETDLSSWARQWVLLINAVLTVEEGKAWSHQGRGWEDFTDECIRALSRDRDHIVFILWGAYAQKKAALIDTARHHIITSPHPSPFSAHTGFFGSRPFSRTNEYLQGLWLSQIDWSK